MSPRPDERIAVICFEMVMVAFAAPVLVGSAWSKERELGNMDMIRMTLLRARDMYVGKAAGGIVALLPVLAALQLTTLPVFFWHFRDSVLLLCGLMTTLTCAALALALCLYASIAARRTTTAIAYGALLCVAAFFGVSVLAVLLQQIDVLSNTDVFLRSLQTFSPIIQYGVAFGDDGFSSRHNGPAQIVIWMYRQLPFLALACAVAAASVYRLSRREMRDS